jgi:hypothetical protein
MACWIARRGFFSRRDTSITLVYGHGRRHAKKPEQRERDISALTSQGVHDYKRSSRPRAGSPSAKLRA